MQPNLLPLLFISLLLLQAAHSDVWTGEITYSCGTMTNCFACMTSTLISESCPCSLHLLRNGHCDAACNVSECDFDKGDCVDLDLCGCEKARLGDGICDEECRSAECGEDMGDCGADYGCAWCPSTNGCQLFIAPCDGGFKDCRSGFLDISPEVRGYVPMIIEGIVGAVGLCALLCCGLFCLFSCSERKKRMAAAKLLDLQSPPQPKGAAGSPQPPREEKDSQPPSSSTTQSLSLPQPSASSRPGSQRNTASPIMAADYHERELQFMPQRGFLSQEDQM